MVSLINSQRSRFGAGPAIIEEYRGLSTDAKPELSADRNGSTFFEMDTGSVYMYDGDALSWVMV